MHNEVPLLQKAYDFYRAYYETVDHFSKKSRIALSVKIEESILDLIQLISNASFASQVDKAKILNEASCRVDFLKLLFRLCYELRIIDKKKYFFFAEKILEIGKMIGGWMKSTSHS